jgi:hypothetical protein
MRPEPATWCYVMAGPWVGWGGPSTIVYYDETFHFSFQAEAVFCVKRLIILQ